MPIWTGREREDKIDGGTRMYGKPASPAASSNLFP